MTKSIVTLVERDPHRRCDARRVEDLDEADAAPGSVEVLAIDGTVWGYGFTCPGCGSQSFLALGAENPHPRWTVAAGDAARPETVSLSPSILHPRERGGCGWHGYLRRGEFTPC